MTSSRLIQFTFKLTLMIVILLFQFLMACSGDDSFRQLSESASEVIPASDPSQAEGEQQESESTPGENPPISSTQPYFSETPKDPSGYVANCDRLKPIETPPSYFSDEYCSLSFGDGFVKLLTKKPGDYPTLSVEMCVQLPGQTSAFPLTTSLNLNSEINSKSVLEVNIGQVKELFQRGYRVGNIRVDIGVCNDKDQDGRCSDESLRCTLSLPGVSFINGKLHPYLDVGFISKGNPVELRYPLH